MGNEDFHLLIHSKARSDKITLHPFASVEKQKLSASTERN
jgi:hypothetical protein